jgi:hypothetical protein
MGSNWRPSPADDPLLPEVGVMGVSKVRELVGRSSHALLRALADLYPAPTRVRIPRLDADSTLIEVSVGPDGSWQLGEVEESARQAGWYGVKPGQNGTAVIMAHRDLRGEMGVFFYLNRLVSGDTIEVDLEDGSTLVFTVNEVEPFLKEGPQDGNFSRVFGSPGHPALRILSCGGRFVGGDLGYEAVVVAFADLTSVQARSLRGRLLLDAY